MIDNEELILVSVDRKITLSTHKIRLNTVAGGSGQVTSILLEHVSSCQVFKKSNLLFIVIAIIAFIVGVAVSVFIGNAIPAGVGVLIAIVFIAIYYGSKEQILIVDSPTASIPLEAKNMPLSEVLDFIDMLENAATQRRDNI